MGAVQMLTPTEVNKEVWSTALSYLMFLKRKRKGDVKARGCADGRPQREYISKDESSSPTVSFYALMASCLMDAIDDREVVTCDIPGAFLQADWPVDKDCFLKFENVTYSFGTITDTTYPATEEAVITLLDSVKRGNDNSNNKAAAGGDDDAAIVAAHEIEYISNDDDYYFDEESTDEEESVNRIRAIRFLGAARSKIFRN
jgi:hypothetical protein